MNHSFRRLQARGVNFNSKQKFGVVMAVILLHVFPILYALIRSRSTSRFKGVFTTHVLFSITGFSSFICMKLWPLIANLL